MVAQGCITNCLIVSFIELYICKYVTVVFNVLCAVKVLYIYFTICIFTLQSKDVLLTKYMNVM